MNNPRDNRSIAFIIPLLLFAIMAIPTVGILVSSGAVFSFGLLFFLLILIVLELPGSAVWSNISTRASG